MNADPPEGESSPAPSAPGDFAAAGRSLAAGRVPLTTILREWGRIGCIGFGGPPTHIKLLRELCVERRGWLDGRDFEDAIAACNLLPGPASTQLAIYCAWRLRGRVGALIGGAAFIIPGLIVNSAPGPAPRRRPHPAVRGRDRGDHRPHRQLGPVLAQPRAWRCSRRVGGWDYSCIGYFSRWGHFCS